MSNLRGRAWIICENEWIDIGGYKNLQTHLRTNSPITYTAEWKWRVNRYVEVEFVAIELGGRVRIKQLPGRSILITGDTFYLEDEGVWPAG